MDLVKLSREDAPRIGALARETYAAAWGHEMTQTHLHALFSSSLSDAAFGTALVTDTILGAELEGHLIGYIQFGPFSACPHRPAPAADAAEIRRLYVQKAHQSRQLGATLLREAMAHPSVADASELYLHAWETNHGAQRLYRRFGFHPVGRRPEYDPQGKHTGDDLLMLRTAPAVHLRYLHPDDLADFQAYRRDPGLAEYQGWSVQEDAAALEFLTHMQQQKALKTDNWLQLAVYCNQTGRLIGDVGLRVDTRRDIEVGYTLSRSHQGRGLATVAVSMALAFAANNGHIETVHAFTHMNNPASAKLLQRLGFSQTEHPDAAAHEQHWQCPGRAFQYVPCDFREE